MSNDTSVLFATRGTSVRAALTLSGAFLAITAALAQTSPPSTPAAVAPASAPDAAASAAALNPARLRSAPTLETLARLKIAEKEAQARERYEKMFPKPPAPAASKPAAEKVAVVPRQAVPVEPQRTRRVLAVHGRVGQEKVDIERSDGVIGTYAVGTVVDGYRIRQVTADGVTLDVPSRPCLNQATETHTRKNKAAEPAPAMCGGGTTTVRVGGLFR